MRSYLINFVLVFVVMGIPAISLGGYALEFDGDDDYVSLDHQSLDGIEDCTVEYWVIINEEDAGAATFSGARDAQDQWNEYLHWFDFNDANGFGPHQKQSVFYIGEFPIDEWFHLAVTREGGTGESIIYLNGEVWAELNYPQGDLDIGEGGLILGQEQDALGGGFSDAQALLGQLDELRIWNYIRSEEEIVESMNIMVDPDLEGLVAYYRFDEGDGQELADLTENEYHGRLGDDEDEDDADPTWVVSEAPVWGGELEISRVDFELEPLVLDEEVEFTLSLMNVSDEEDDNLAIEYEIVSPEEDRPDWFDFTSDNISGEISVGDTVNIEMIAKGNVDPGLYDYSFVIRNNSINLQNQDVIITVWITEGFGLISGEVKDATNDDPLPGAMVELFSDLDFSQFTDESGDFEFEDMPAANYMIKVTLDGYISFEEDFQLEDEGEAEFEIWLYHGEFAINTNEINVIIEPPPESDSRDLQLTNDGNGTVNWVSDIQVIIADDIETWTIKELLPIDNEVEDTRIEGVIFADENFYLTGSNGDDLNYIYVLDNNGDLVRSFTQPDSSRLGAKDMAWDGNLIWICKGSNIWGITTEGELETTLRSPHNSTSYIAYDPDRDLLWVSSVTSELIGIDMQGNIEFELERDGFRKSGLAYNPAQCAVGTSDL